ncbi:MAG TPA: class I SAM-dependent methyltransferase [Casimicrobiaceae bacterium]|nr:class I SAM-dependent methyltransferase [Casimicrobiaceae bacterium]
MQPTPANEGVNADLLALIPPRAPRVVEAGCSVGTLAREYRAANPDCDYVGIELEPVFAELARRHCTRVLEADLERMSDADLDALAPADCWVLGDVLEHLVDPWRFLARLPSRLRAGGCVVACIPNMQHWSVVARLVTGNLYYEDQGLLDRTHLRWFTRATAMHLFQSAGFKVTLFVGRRFRDRNDEAAVAAVSRLASTLGVDAEQAAREAAAFQWLVRAVPNPA